MAAVGEQRVGQAVAFADQHRPQREHVVLDLAFQGRKPGDQCAADRHRCTEHGRELAAPEQPALVDGFRRAARARLEQRTRRVDVVDMRADDLRVRRCREPVEQLFDPLRIAGVVAREADQHVPGGEVCELGEVRAQPEVARRAANGDAVRALVARHHLARDVERAVAAAVVGDDDLAGHGLRERRAQRLSDRRLVAVGDDEDRRRRPRRAHMLTRGASPAPRGSARRRRRSRSC